MGEGDLPEMAAVVAEERRRLPSLKATLVLTCNQEPREDLVRDIHAAAALLGISVDLWSCSRLAHFLDNPPGQWLRRKYLGITEERVSPSLLRELSAASLRLNSPHDDPSAWINNRLDQTIASLDQQPVTFVIAASGLGKSVACHKRLAAHVASGGIVLVLSDAVVAAAPNVEQAVEASLRQLYPSLTVGCGSEACRIGSAAEPLLLVVEDINRSGEAPKLLDKLDRWSHIATDQKAECGWRILCPVWPQILVPLDDHARKHVEAKGISGTPFTSREGREAVERRAAIRGVSVTAIEAEALAEALGHDPLLIALNDTNERPDASGVIGRFIGTVVAQVAVRWTEYTAVDYRTALCVLASEMLRRRDLDPLWTSVTQWSVGTEVLAMLRHLLFDARVIRLLGTRSEERIGFRHDRVRDELLIEAMAEMIRRRDRAPELISDPYFAEIVGGALAVGPTDPNLINDVIERNPLAVIHAFRRLGTDTTGLASNLLTAINHWLDAPSTHSRQNRHLRSHSLAALSEIEAPNIPALVERFQESTWAAFLGRFRNGDVMAGISLCWSVDFGSAASWRDQQIEHAKARYDEVLIANIGHLLRDPTLETKVRVGALRLAGHLADVRLARAIEASWAEDGNRGENLDEYLWAAAQCCGNDPARFLGPICDAWAALPVDQKMGHSRNNLAASAVRWGFRRQPPSRHFHISSNVQLATICGGRSPTCSMQLTNLQFRLSWFASLPVCIEDPKAGRSSTIR